MFGQASHEKNTNGETALRPRQGFLDETAHYFAYPANLDQGEITIADGPASSHVA
jgi:hypothetical protein